MQELIQISQLNGVEVVDSRIIAEELGVQHKNLIETIRKYQEAIESDFGLLTFETQVSKQQTGFGFRDNHTEFCYLTEDQALFIGTLSRNSEIVVKFKAKLVKSFQASRKLQSQAVAQSLPQTYADALRALAEKVESEAKLKAENAILAPKAKYMDDVLESVTEITTTTIAKELGMSAYALNKKLCEHKIQYYHDGHYVLGHIYHSNGYTETRTHTWKDKTGVTRTKLYTVWTERGRAFIHALFNTKLGFSNNTSNIQTVHLHEQETQR